MLHVCEHYSKWTFIALNLCKTQTLRRNTVCSRMYVTCCTSHVASRMCVNVAFVKNQSQNVHVYLLVVGRIYGLVVGCSCVCWFYAWVVARIIKWVDELMK